MRSSVTSKNSVKKTASCVQCSKNFKPISKTSAADSATSKGYYKASHAKVVLLGDPGSGKSSLMRYLALRWALLDDAALRDTQPLPLLIELGHYGRWQCEGRKDFFRYLDEAATWHRWDRQTLDALLSRRSLALQSRASSGATENSALESQATSRVTLLLDGLDEIFDLDTRKDVINDIQSFCNEYKDVRIVVTSRVVGYQPQRLRDTGFQHFMLQDLAQDQIDDFLDRWHEVTFEDRDKIDAQPSKTRTRVSASQRFWRWPRSGRTRPRWRCWNRRFRRLSLIGFAIRSNRASSRYGQNCTANREAIKHHSKGSRRSGAPWDCKPNHHRTPKGFHSAPRVVQPIQGTP
jgi:predicted NACHT family NTPase